MTMPFPSRTQIALLATLPLSLFLGGCGGADDGENVPALSAGADYQDIVAYCKVDESRPGGGPGPGAGNGWVNAVEWLAGGVNQAATFISHDGNATLWDQPVTLAVPLFDYRTLPAKFAFAPGFNQHASMGTAFATLLPKGGVGCATQLTKVAYSAQVDWSGIPGWTGSSPSDAAQPYSMSWKSYWDASLPLSRLPGTPVDGFELVANFVPADGQSFFNLEKSRFATVAGMSICYLAPRASSWDCAAPSSADLGATWQLARTGAKPGAYVLVAPAR